MGNTVAERFCRELCVAREDSVTPLATSPAPPCKTRMTRSPFAATSTSSSPPLGELGQKLQLLRLRVDEQLTALALEVGESVEESLAFLMRTEYLPPAGTINAQQCQNGAVAVTPPFRESHDSV